MAVAGVPEHDDRNLACGGLLPDKAEIACHLLDGQASVLDYLKRSALLGQTCQNWAGGSADAPEPFRRLSGECGINPMGNRPEACRGQLDCFLERSGIVPLQLDQE